MEKQATDRYSDEIDFKEVLKRFSELNEARLKRTVATLAERQQDFLHLLPLLFHINHPLLPGYVSRYTPAGLFEYEPDKQTLNKAKAIAKSISYRRSLRRKRPILALYVMGSPGTVAYTESSDLDIWVCHDPKLDSHHVDLLQQKSTGIEAWAENFGLEAHIFLINPETFRQGHSANLSTESSGSAQHYLLLEEFYRTGILLAGQKPMWWLVPPDRENEYDDYVDELKRKRFIHAKNTIDLGGIGNIPAEEFFGAALWQLYKGIDSPYKSILKLLLIEAYASEFPQIDLLSHHFKQRVYAGEKRLNDIDPYILMLEKVTAYLEARGERQRLELVRRCFYFKTNERLSIKKISHSGWRLDLLHDLVARWGWRHTDLILMDTRDTWKVQRVAEERRILYEALIASYRFLSDFARQQSSLVMIDEFELTILGRKLYTTFERKAGKIEVLNRGITSSLHEPQISLHEVIGRDHQSSWLVYSGMVTRETMDNEIPLKRSRSAVALIGWCYFNGIINANTIIGVYTQGSDLDVKEFYALQAYLSKKFPIAILGSSPIEDYEEAARLTHHSLFVNFAAHPLDVLNLPRHDVASSSADALSYSTGQDNLVMSLDMVLATSWHEILTHRYAGERCLMDGLCEYLSWYPPSQDTRPAPINVYAAKAHRGTVVTHRIEQLFEDIVECYYGGEYPLETRYILAIGSGYCVVYFEEDKPRYDLLGSYSELQKYLAAPQVEFSPVLFDRHALKHSPLPQLFARNKEGFVQLFYLPKGNRVDVYILDERGSLFYRNSSYFDERSLISQYSRFFEQVLNRVNFMMQEGDTSATTRGLEFYRINPQHGFSLARQAPEFSHAAQHYFSLQVLVDNDEDGQTVFTVYCEGKEFSTLEYGDQLYQSVVDHILFLRKSGQSYPIHITDIGFSRSVLGEEGVGKVQTLHFLNYKRRIEDRLNRSMTDK